MLNGLLEYAKGKKFKEKFKEYRYSGKEITVDDDGNIVYLDKEDANGNTINQVGLTGDKETLELVKGNSKIEITYQEVE